MTIDEMKRRLNADYYDMTTEEINREITKINKLERKSKRQRRKQWHLLTENLMKFIQA